MSEKYKISTLKVTVDMKTTTQATSMRVIGLEVFLTAKESKHTEMETHTRDKLCTGKNSDKEFIILQMERCMKAVFTIIKAMVWEKWHTRIKRAMMVNGNWVNFMEKAVLFFKLVKFTKEITWMEKDKDMENIRLEMVVTMKETGKMECSREKECSIKVTTESKANGLMDSL